MKSFKMEKKPEFYINFHLKNKTIYTLHSQFWELTQLLFMMAWMYCLIGI